MIRTEGLLKVYRLGEERIRALDGIDLAIEAGEFVAVMGPSGSGKSTLMHVLGCLDSPDGGRYWLDGQEVAALGDDERSALRARRIGFVFQAFHLLPRLSALDNVLLPARYAGGITPEVRDRATALLQRLGLGERLHHRPNQLSGGQRQRVAIARALINHPAVIFADEPTGNLDSRTSREIMTLFVELNREGQTVVLVTHEEDIAAHARRIIVLRDGRIESDRHVA
ncbi:MAG: macrolide ABC transporter ATP-binding protein [Lysobacterales bacterium]|nr:MAG: macrolide ABC transporter ATP-binding protein [Xanthomonadales bacterium]